MLKNLCLPDMEFLYTGCSGFAVILTCFVVHQCYAHLMDDPTNIEISITFGTAVVTFLLHLWGLPFTNTNSPATVAVWILIAILVVWKFADWITILTLRQCLMLSVVSNFSYLAFFYAAWAGWSKVFGLDNS